MRARTRAGMAGVGAVVTAALVTGISPAANAAPGDWTNLSNVTSATRYPEILNFAQPTLAWFGSSVQVLWPQSLSPNQEAYFTAVVDSDGRVTTGSTQAFAPWGSVTKFPTLLNLGGQRFLSFSGLNPDRSGAQYYATAPDATSWSISGGSLSESQSAYAAYGSDAIDNAGTPVWVGNAGTSTGIRWHVGTSPTNPAPPGSDQTYLLAGCCAYNAAVARDEATGAVYAAFYSNSSATSENGIQVGQILPGAAGWRQAPGSTKVENGAADSLDPNQTVAMTGRAGGGVFVAYTMDYPTPKAIRVLNVVTGATLDITNVKDPGKLALSSEPDGRLWLTWKEGTKLKAVHSNPSATRFGAIGSWGAPPRTESTWRMSIAGTAGGAAVAMTATTSNAINVWYTEVSRTLGIKASAARVGRGGNVTFTVTDAGDPVSGARVTFGGRAGTTNGQGKVTLSAPGRGGRATATAKKGAYNPGTTSVQVR